MKKTFLALILTLVCGTALQLSAQPNQQITVLINRQNTIVNKKLTIRFLSLVEDSRCPTDTNCIWEGNAKIKIKVSNSKGVSKIFEINTNTQAQTVSFAGYEIKLTDLNPRPATNIRINRNGYTAIFTVTKVKI
jgi:hypothetical protein